MKNKKKAKKKKRIKKAQKNKKTFSSFLFLLTPTYINIQLFQLD